MKTNEDLIPDLLKKVESGKHIQFQYLRNWQEYSNVKRIKRAHALLLGSLKQSTNRQFKQYCADIAVGKTALVKLLAYCTTNRLIDFYKEELQILESMLEEYEAYLTRDSNVLFAWLFNEQRPVDKLYDHRS
jgi:uncharacterized protein YgbK (DUF1537 family)